MGQANGFGLRGRVILWVALFQIVLLGGVSALYLQNARQVMQAEQDTAQRVARDLVLSTVGALVAENDADLISRLAERLAPLRHVRLRLFGADTIERPLIAEQVPVDPPPAWFTRLLTPPPKTIRIPVVDARRRVLGIVLIEGAPAQDLARYWQEARWLVGLSFAALVVLTALLYTLIGRALSPLTSMRRALEELEGGELTTTVTVPRNPDLAPIAAQVNHLAGSLASAEASRKDLSRRLTDLQEAERKHIAMELHDEMGPCLFGLSAEADRLSQHPNPELRGAVSNIQTVVSELRQINRRVLAALRPMTVGQLPLTDVLRDLVATRSAAFPDVPVDLDIAALPRTSEALDLTVFRFVQEAMTNAYRHSGTNRIDIRVAPTGEDLSVLVRDYGTGPGTLTPGTGLRGMEERLRAQGGQFTLRAPPGGGTELHARLPIEAP